MKKYILALALLFVCHIGFAQDLNSLFDEFKKEPNADCISIPPFLTVRKTLFTTPIFSSSTTAFTASLLEIPN